MYYPAISLVKFYDLHGQVVESYDIISYQYRDSGGMVGKFAIVLGKDRSNRIVVRDYTSVQKIVNFGLAVKVDLDKVDLNDIQSRKPELYDIIKIRDTVRELYETKRKQNEKLADKYNRMEAEGEKTI